MCRNDYEMAPLLIRKITERSHPELGGLWRFDYKTGFAHCAEDMRRESRTKNREAPSRKDKLEYEKAPLNWDWQGFLARRLALL